MVRPAIQVAAAAGTLDTIGASAPDSMPATVGQPAASNSDVTSSSPDLSNYVTKTELNSDLSALSGLSASLLHLIAAYPPSTSTGPAQYNAVSEGVAANGNGIYPYAGTNRINNLADVSISNATIDAGSIPNLSGSYLSLKGGTVSGDLTVTGTLNGGSLNLSNASTSRLSIFSNAYFGGTATSSFDSTGALTLATPLAVSSGGTGANTFGQGWIYSNGGVGGLAASTSPTVNYITATSTTATNYFASFINTSGTSGGYKIDGNLILQSSSTRSSIFLGQGAGNSYMTGAQDTALGYNALYSDTTGYNNIATGYQALFSNTTGNSNIANGVNALYSNTTGVGNVANGLGALYSNTTGYDNTATGNGTLYSNTTGDYNTAAGMQALSSNTTGIDNTAIGYQSAFSNTTGGTITAVGYNALYSNTTGWDNNALGYNALYNNTMGIWNVGIGNTALHDNTTGNNNIAIGIGALASSTTASDNTAVGTLALQSNLTGVDNVAIGESALASNTTASNLTATGNGALHSNTTGNYNTANGTQALYSSTIASNNIATGYQALFSNTTGNSNTANGMQALYSNIAGGLNVALGNLALYSNTGSNNTAVGGNSGYGITSGTGNVLIGVSIDPASYNQITTGSNNIAIGHNVAVASSTLSNQLNIGNLIYGTNLNGTGSTLSTGNIGIGTTSPAHKLSVWGAGTSGYFSISHLTSGDVFQINSAGNVGIGTTSPYALLAISNSASTAANTPLFVIASTTGGTATTTVLSVASTGNVTIVGSAATCTLGNGASATNCSSSDERLKDNITTIDASSSLSAIEALRPVSFNWNQWMVGNGAATTTQFGFIAQEIMHTFPNLVTLDSNTHYYKLDYQGLFAPIVGSIQALASEVSGFADAFTTKELTFTRATGDEIDTQTARTQTLCVGSTCVTESQLKAMLAATGQASAESGAAQDASSNSSVASSTPPVIQVNGNNPAYVTVGDSYNDLGATITGPQADLNLGIKTFLNGALTSNIVVDTSAVATDTIDYAVTDQNGLASTSTRTVIIQAPQAAVVSSSDASTSAATSSEQ